MTKRERRVAEKRAKLRHYLDDVKRGERARKKMGKYKPPTPDPGTPCERCEVEAASYWFANNQDPDPDTRLYGMKPVCYFHFQAFRALWLKHQLDHGVDPEASPSSKRPDGFDEDLYGDFVRPDELDMEPEALEALATKTLNEHMDVAGASQFSEADLIRSMLDWTLDDRLIMVVWARIMKTLFEEGTYAAGGPPDVVDEGRAP